MVDKTPKLRAIAIREIKFARPNKLNSEKVIAALSSLSRTLNNVDELQDQADLLHIEAVLVSEGINDNDDAFTRDELKRAISSPLLKPMNWKHDDTEILGAMYAVEARDMQGNPLTVAEIDDQPIELIIQGVIWHHLPHIKVTAEEIVQRVEQGDLFVSMECWFDNYDYGFYTQAGELFDTVARTPGTAFLDGYLRANGGTGRYNNMRIGRALSGVSFGGVAFVDKPANKRSLILNHFAFDPIKQSEGANVNGDGLEDQVTTKTTLYSNKEPLEVNMNDLNHATASADSIAQGVEKAFAAREQVESQKQTQADHDKAVVKVATLEGELAKANESLELLQAAIDQAYAGATSNTPPEIAKIDSVIESGGSGSELMAAKLAWISDSHKAVAGALNESTSAGSDTKLIEENTALKAELSSIKTEIRKNEIEYLFADILEMDDDEVKSFVEAGLAQNSDESYTVWLDEKKVFAKKILEFKNKDKKDKKDKKDSEAGLLAPSDSPTAIDDNGAVLNSRHGRVPSDVARTPRSRLNAAAANLEDLFETVNEPDLSAANPVEEPNSNGAMGRLIGSLLGTKDNKEV